MARTIRVKIYKKRNHWSIRKTFNGGTPPEGYLCANSHQEEVGYYFIINYRSMSKNQHVAPHNGSWAIRGAGNNRVTVITSAQDEAIGIAREIARNQQSELFIHRPNGQIRNRDSYGSDPYPPRG